MVLAVAILTIQCGDLPDEGDVAGVELVNNTGGNANLIVLWLDDGKTAQDVLDDMGTQPVTSGSPPPWVSDMGGAAPVGSGEILRREQTLDGGRIRDALSAELAGRNLVRKRIDRVEV